MPDIGNLPHVALGNVATDIGSAGTNLIQGLVQQRLRQQQIAMQQALQNAQISHLNAQTGLTTAQTGAVPSEEALRGAQTGDINQQTQQREYENQPTDESDFARLKAVAPDATPDMVHGMRKADFEQYLFREMQNRASEHRMNLMISRMGMTGGNAAYTRFLHTPDIQRATDAKDAYDNLNALLNANTALGYNEIFGALARMALPANARAVSSMMIRLHQTGILQGPYNPQENVELTLNRLANSQGTLPLSPAMKQEIINTARAMLLPHIQKYDSVKKTIAQQMQMEGLPFGPDYLEQGDRFQDVRGMTYGTGQNPPSTGAAPGAPGYVP
jgi:hypothetical protein